MKSVKSEIFGWLIILSVILFWGSLAFHAAVGGFAQVHAELSLLNRFVVASLGLPILLYVLWLANGLPRALIRRYITDSLEQPKLSRVPKKFGVRDWTVGIFFGVFVFVPIFLGMGPAISGFFDNSMPWIWSLSGLCFLLWVTSREYRGTHTRLVLKSIRGLVLPVTIGWTCVVWMQVIFNLFDVNVQFVRLIENRIGYLSFEAKKWVDFLFPESFFMMLLFIALLIAVAMVAPRLQPVTRGKAIQSWVHSAVMVLACISGFTFLAQIPFKYQDLSEQRRIVAERAEEEKGNRDDLRYLAALSIQNSLTSLSLADRDSLRERLKSLFEEINKLAPYREHGRITKMLVDQQFAAANDDNAELREKLSAIEKQNGFNSHERGGENAQGEPVDLPSTRSAQLLAGLGSLFSGLLGHVAPETEGIASRFLSALLDREADYFYDQNLRPVLSEHFGDLLPETSRLTSRFLRMEYGPAAGSEGGPRDAIEDERMRIREEVQRARETMEREVTVPEEEAPVEVTPEEP
jgi:MFS family permease